MKNDIIPYNPALKELARQLRNNSTLSEILLWKQLKGDNITGCDFHRQKPILNYIVDFYCPKMKLAIEIDGITHDNPEALIKDKERQEIIEKFGIRFLRFNDWDVKRHPERIAMYIRDWILENTPPAPL